MVCRVGFFFSFLTCVFGILRVCCEWNVSKYGHVANFSMKLVESWTISFIAYLKIRYFKSHRDWHSHCFDDICWGFFFFFFRFLSLSFAFARPFLRSQCNWSGRAVVYWCVLKILSYDFIRSATKTRRDWIQKYTSYVRFKFFFSCYAFWIKKQYSHIHKHSFVVSTLALRFQLEFVCGTNQNRCLSFMWWNSLGSLSICGRFSVFLL